MFLVDIVMEEVQLPLKQPFRTALREATHTKSLYVKLICDNGIEGIGECTETVAITGETVEGQRYLINNYIKPRLLGKNLLVYQDILNKLVHWVPFNYSAKAAIDIAIHDAVSKYYKIPLYQLLGGEKKSFDTSVTISLDTKEKMLNQALTYVEQGFYLFKIKFGHNWLEEVNTLEYLVSELPLAAQFRIDANQGWDLKDSLKFIGEIGDLENRIQFIEQPVHKWKTEDLKKIKSVTKIPIMADESVFHSNDLKIILEKEMIDMINIKLMKCGGIQEAKKMIHMAQIYQVPCMIGCMLETEVSVSAALQLAMANSQIKFIDLDAPLLINSDLTRLKYKKGNIGLK